MTARSLSPPRLSELHESGEVPVREIHPREGHRAALEEALASGADVLLSFNDVLAVRLLRTLREMDVEVPGGVRLVGIDGLEIASLVTPELTTLSIDIEAVARETVSLVEGMSTAPCRSPGRRPIAWCPIASRWGPPPERRCSARRTSSSRVGGAARGRL